MQEAALLMQENADPDLRHGLERFLAGMTPEDPALYRHTADGPDDMPAHIKTAVTRTRLGIPQQDGRLALGTWQGV